MRDIVAEHAAYLALPLWHLSFDPASHRLYRAATEKDAAQWVLDVPFHRYQGSTVLFEGNGFYGVILRHPDKPGWEQHAPHYVRVTAVTETEAKEITARRNAALGFDSDHVSE